jgi:hypothetical protein
MRQQFEALFTKDEDHAAAAMQGIQSQAYYEAQEAAPYTTTLRSL